MRSEFMGALRESLRLFVAPDPFASPLLGGGQEVARATSHSRRESAAQAQAGSSGASDGVSASSSDNRVLATAPPPEFRRRHTSPLPFRRPPPAETGVFAPALPQLQSLASLQRQALLPTTHIAHTLSDNHARSLENLPPCNSYHQGANARLLRPSSAISRYESFLRCSFAAPSSIFSTLHAGYAPAPPSVVDLQRRPLDAGQPSNPIERSTLLAEQSEVAVVVEGRRITRAMSLQLRRDASLPTGLSYLRF
eukprot:Gregarina_sp_Pseudo_9__5911@NODE_93_length_4340_cov_42_102767_g85_i0_p3_GENE_NODE_93_length_4340_cov_42_102767_g85_i0NODE_93_length_4340_cov_42_102767_g85_i0_p3_ORF_typecomplete_len252_score55_49_NODE_93_length_4340_cov_42_102767_g85_i02841039